MLFRRLDPDGLTLLIVEDGIASAFVHDWLEVSIEMHGAGNVPDLQLPVGLDLDVGVCPMMVCWPCPVVTRTFGNEVVAR